MGQKFLTSQIRANYPETTCEGELVICNGKITTKVNCQFVWSYQGSSYGYVFGGRGVCPIDKFSFADETTGNCVGDLAITTPLADRKTSGITSGVFGYSVGGAGCNPGIEKWPFAVDENSTCVADLAIGTLDATGHATENDGFTLGGIQSFAIQKFPFASDDNATCVGSANVDWAYASDHSSTTDGYSVSGGPRPASFPYPLSGSIQKFPFASATTSTCVGAAGAAGTTYGAGISSATDGYHFMPSYLDKWPFASDTPTTTVASPSSTIPRNYRTGASATEYGYGVNGLPALNQIFRFSYASEAQATCVGTLPTSSGCLASSTHY